MLDIQNNQLVKISFFLFLLVIIAIIRLICVQIIDHEYYEMKTIKQRKMSKEISLRREYLILPSNAYYRIEINLWLLLDKQKRLVFRDSMRNLSKLINVDEQTVYWACLKKLQVIQQIIQRKIKEEVDLNSQTKELISKIEYRELNKPYPLNLPNVQRDQAIQLEIEKYLWINNKEKELVLYDRFRGFSIRAMIRKNKKN